MMSGLRAITAALLLAIFVILWFHKNAIEALDRRIPYLSKGEPVQCRERVGP